jgi:cytochrome c oxidase cbb3-type subunit 3
MPTKIEKDDLSGQTTTGHEWDGLKELNHPLPRWWLWVFVACVIWSIGYWVAYPAIPTPNGVTKGILGYSSRGDVNAEVAALNLKRAAFSNRIAEAPLADILANADLREVALAAGKAAFGNNCAPCHGSNAAGRPGYPNLNSDQWIWGGSLDEIHQTISHGVRWESDSETHASLMPNFGVDGILTKEQISDVADYVRSVKGFKDDPVAAARGEAIFSENCVACHGANAEGNPAFGAPPLNGPSRLYGAAKADIAAQVYKPRHGVMPAWSQRLDAVTIKELTVYVHALGGGK